MKMIEAPWVGREPDYCEMIPKEIPPRKPVTKANTEGLMEEICDHVCKWPAEYKDSDDLWNEKCDHCPVTDYLESVCSKLE